MRWTFIALFLLATNCQVAVVTHLAQRTNVKFMSSECGIFHAHNMLAELHPAQGSGVPYNGDPSCQNCKDTDICITYVC